VSISDRDRKILIAIVPLVILLGYWFLVLSPKRQEATKLGDDLAKQEQKRDELNAEVERLNSDRKSFASDYSTVVELGKAVPTTVDMPSLIVQLQKAASGTAIQFDRIHAGDRVPAAQPASAGTAGASTASSSSSSSGSTPPASAAGGQKAVTAPGTAVEKANNTKASSEQQAQSTGSTGGANGSTGSTPAGASGQPTSGAPGLDAVPLEFTFVGSFYDMADFFHRAKRFVWVANHGGVAVHGRLLTIDGFDLKASDKGFPQLEAQMFATAYLAPKSEGATGGANPSGPAATPAGTQPAGSAPSPAPAQPPAATVTAR
jgi:Tfp pilus assembly protein PilO